MVTEIKEKSKSSNLLLILLISFGVFCLILLGILLSGDSTSTNNQNFESDASVSDTLSQITKSPESMLPLVSELPTEYSMEEKKDITNESSTITSRNAEEGFDSGKRLSISKYKVGTYTVTDYIEITFGIYKFDNPNYASDFQKKVSESVKNSGGYEKISVSSDAECFAWTEDYGYGGGRFGDSICVRSNVVFWTSVSITNSFKQPDSYVKDMTKILDRKVN